MATLSSFLPEVLPEVPNCSNPVAENAILNALVEFCKKSRYWVVDLTAIDIVADQALYDVASSVTNTKVHELYHVNVYGKDLDPISHDELNKVWPRFSAYLDDSNAYTPWQEYSTDQPTHYHQPSRDKVLLFGIPSTAETGGLVMSAAIYPTSSISNVIPDDIYEEYREAIGFGAKYRLMKMPQKDWTDYQASAANMTLFNQQVAEAKGKRIRDFARDNRPVLRSKVYY